MCAKVYINNNKDRILEAVFFLSLKYGFDNVSIKQIQDEANVSAGAIYYYFKDKNDILLNLLNKGLKKGIKVLDKELKKYEGTFVEKLKFIFYYHIGTNIDDESYKLNCSEKQDLINSEYNLFLLGIYHQHPEFRPIFHETNRGMVEIFTDFTEEFKQKNEIRRDMDSEEIAFYIYTVVSGFSKLWIGFPDIELEEFIDKCIKMIVETVAVKN